MTWGTPQRRKTQGQSLKSVSVPAPIGGINTIDPGLAMPASDCIYAYNLIAAEYGLRSRLGYQEWSVGLTGDADNTVRTVLPFVDASALNNKLFACTSSGIWDVTTPGVPPTQPIVFVTQTEQAGYGISTVMVNPLLGHTLLYCDEENGLFYWSNGWIEGVNAVNAQWLPDTAVILGVQIVSDGNAYVVINAGVTGPSSAGPPTGTGPDITDGTAHWAYVGSSTGSSIGPSIADQNNGITLDVTQLASVTVWKSRVFFVEKNSARGWYLDVNAVFGEATSFNFGAKMRAGGPLVGLYNWSYDAGNGIDTHLVGVSSAGDIVIYSGTDPTSADTFGLTGCWSVGAVPAGRRIVTDYGGDILIMSTLGVVPLSKLVVGQPVVNGSRSPYATAKISNLFNSLVANFGTNLGWAMVIHPVDNALLLLVPLEEGGLTEQLAMSWATQGWTQYRDLPMLNAAVFQGQLYFGTPDGRVCLNTGYVDDVKLDTLAFTPVAWSLLTAYTNMGNAQQKQVKMVRPNMTSDGIAPQAVPTVMYGFNLTEPPPPPFTAPPDIPGGGAWGSSLWDSAIWGGSFYSTTPYQPIYGASGMGREVAVALRGAAINRTILVALDVFFETGGLL